MLVYLQAIESDADKTKFEQIYLKYRGLMFHVANKILNNESDAEDAVHQAFLDLIGNMDKISDACSVKTRSFVVVLAERRAIDIARKRNDGVIEFEDQACGLEITLPEEHSLAAAMAAIPARYKEILLLRYDNGYSTAELAEILGMKRATVQKLLWRAKDALENSLEKDVNQREK